MLYVIATPIGNLQDITLRALEVLKSVDKIYCEDTRVTRKLLTHFDIHKPTDSFHHHSSEKKIEQILFELKEGKDIAYVSDAGTPGISDPVGLLVKAVQEAGLAVSPIPGASAVTSILSVAGINASQYQFWGFVPTKKGRQTFIKKIISSDIPVVVFETGPRIQKFLREITELGGENCQLTLGRELTKQFEQLIYGTPEQVLNELTETRGEFVIVISSK